MSSYWKGRPKTSEQISKMVESKRGKPACNRGKPVPDEQKAKQAATMKEKFRSDPSFAERISQATKVAMLRPDVLAKIRAAAEARIGKRQSPETIAKRAEGIRAAWARCKAADIPFRRKIA